MSHPLAVLALCSALLAAGPVHAQDDWKLIWSDEFNGTALDDTKWTPAIDCGGGGNDERQCYADTPETLSIKDGALRLTVIKRKTWGVANPWAGPTGPLKTGDYASGKIVSQGKFSWRYGRVETRVRVPGGQGVWPAIWMMPELSVYGGWPRSGEIDILETVNLGAPCPPMGGTCADGREDRVFGTLHFAADAAGTHKQVGGSTPMPAAPEGFHVYAVEWSPEAIVWFLDGREYARAKPQDWKRDDQPASAAPFDQSFHLIINLAFGGRWPESVNARGIDEAALPATLEVDWVRVSQRAPSG